MLISFFTRDWKYPQYADQLRDDCETYNIPCLIEERPSTGSYLKNTCLKPKFIKEKLEQLKRPVLWVDCDASLLGNPVFFDSLECDFAAKKMAKERKRTWHVGTMWFNYNDKAMEFVTQWVKNTGAISDESALEKTWRQVKLKAVDIPPEYFQIESSRRPHLPGTVILHRISNSPIKKVELPQAIRRARKGVL